MIPRIVEAFIPLSIDVRMNNRRSTANTALETHDLRMVFAPNMLLNNNLRGWSDFSFT